LPTRVSGVGDAVAAFGRKMTTTKILVDQLRKSADVSFLP
jgi:hypothetical protein